MFAFLVVAVSSVCVEATPVEGEAPSLLPEGREFRLVWHDEFSGDRLDETKWSYRTNFWGKRASWFAAPEDGAVEVGGGVARLRIVKTADGQFRSPQLQTGALVWDDMRQVSGNGVTWPFPKRAKPKFMHRFGYWECRAKLQGKRGWWSAFWLQSPDQGATTDPRRSGIEVDVMESFTPGTHIVHAFHYNGYGADYKRFNAQRAPYTPTAEGAFKKTYPISTDEFHTFGLLWEPDGYTVFIDGRQSGFKVGDGKDEAVSHAEQFLLVTTELMGFRKNGTHDKEVEEAWRSGDSFDVDFVRVFDIVK